MEKRYFNLITFKNVLQMSERGKKKEEVRRALIYGLKKIEFHRVLILQTFEYYNYYPNSFRP